MRRSKAGSTSNRPTFDCHGLTYLEVEDKFENWILMYSGHMPFDVITGNSDEMKTIVKKYLDKYEFKYGVSYFNHGMITVIG